MFGRMMCRIRLHRWRRREGPHGVWAECRRCGHEADFGGSQAVIGG